MRMQAKSYTKRYFEIGLDVTNISCIDHTDGIHCSGIRQIAELLDLEVTVIPFDDESKNLNEISIMFDEVRFFQLERKF